MCSEYSILLLTCKSSGGQEGERQQCEPEHVSGSQATEAAGIERGLFMAEMWRTDVTVIQMPGIVNKLWYAWQTSVPLQTKLSE